MKLEERYVYVNEKMVIISLKNSIKIFTNNLSDKPNEP